MVFIMTKFSSTYLALWILSLSFALSVLASKDFLKLRGTVVVPYFRSREQTDASGHPLLHLKPSLDGHSCKLRIEDDNLECDGIDAGPTSDKTLTLKVAKNGMLLLSDAPFDPKKHRNIILPPDDYKFVSGKKTVYLAQKDEPLSRDKYKFYFNSRQPLKEPLLPSSTKVAVTLNVYEQKGRPNFLQKSWNILKNVASKLKTCSKNHRTVFIPARRSIHTPVLIDVLYNAGEWQFKARENARDNTVSDTTDGALATFYKGNNRYVTKRVRNPNNYKDALAVFVAGDGVCRSGRRFSIANGESWIDIFGINKSSNMPIVQSAEFSSYLETLQSEGINHIYQAINHPNFAVFVVSWDDVLKERRLGVEEMVGLLNKKKSVFIEAKNGNGEEGLSEYIKPEGAETSAAIISNLPTVKWSDKNVLYIGGDVTKCIAAVKQNYKTLCLLHSAVTYA